MAYVTRSYVSQWLKNGKCPGAAGHFRGCAREVYGYLAMLAARNDGFVFAGLENIADHTKKWAAAVGFGDHFSVRHCQRILRDFRNLKVIGARTKREIRKCLVEGIQLYPHASWTEHCGDRCELRFWERLDTGPTKENVVANVVPDVVANVVQNGLNVVVMDDIPEGKWRQIRALHRITRC